MKSMFTWTRSLVILAVLVSFMGPVAQPVSAADRSLWESGEGSVTLVSIDKGKNTPVSPNNHPVVLSDDLLIGLLSSIQIRDTLKEKPGALFTEGALQLMVPYLQEAFRKAGPDDDVAFVIVGLYKSWVASRPMVSTGRLFYKDGKLNLILGVVKQELRYKADGSDRDFRLLVTGSRQTVSQGEWSLVPTEERPFELPRRDWVVLDPKVAFVVAPVTVAPVAKAVAAPVKKGARPLTERLATLNDLKAKGLITDEEYKVKRAEIMSEQEPEKSAADRLSTLNDLKNMGLITPDEYRAKRLQIMNDL